MAGFTIPDNDVATSTKQSIWYSTDIAILVAALSGTGVVSGCGVTAQGSPDMTVAVASGVILAAGASITVTGGNLTIDTAHASLPRLDLISVASNGTKTYTAGTAAASPKPPALPAGNVGLAIVYVIGADTAIDAGEITDKRTMLRVPAWSSGTAMPASPATNDRVTRTDLGLDFYYDGTRWLSTTLYTAQIPSPPAGYTASGSCGRLAVHAPDFDMWIVDAIIDGTVTTPNDGSRYYTFTFYPLAASTNLATPNTTAWSVGTYYQGKTAVGALLGTTNRNIGIDITKTSTPGTALVAAMVTYRLVGA